MTIAERPNVMIIMTDQQRAGFTAGTGFGLDTMPFCDGLAASGTTFTGAYTPMPACVPARTSLLSGRFPSAHRVRQNSNNRKEFRGEDLLDVFRAAGYRTAFAGKPHVYRGPEDYDHWAGPYGHTHAPDRTDQERAFTEWLVSIDQGPALEPTPFPVAVQYPVRIVDDALAQVAADGGDHGRPWLSWVSFPEPHNPYQVPEPYFSLFEPELVPERVAGPEAALAKGGPYQWLRELVEEKRPDYDDLWRRYRASYCGMLRLIDDQVRRLVTSVEERSPGRTLYLFVADHGDFVGEYGLQRKGAGLSEALVRIPFFVAGPGVRAGVDDDHLVSLVDVLPTLAEAIGAEIPAGVQGRSFWPLLTGGDDPGDVFASIYAEGGYGGLFYPADARPELHFDYAGTTYDGLNTVTQSGTSAMLRRGNWKIIFHSDGRGELYRLDRDPAELDDLWDYPDCAVRRAELITELLRWRLEVADDLPTGRYRPLRAPHNWARAAEPT
ncbi:sulfatase family protein [Microlunatus parietis]|uniref:Arylsulfatase A-like enzyme n=1 Tax=Microlunatus parietis TaxID=682979 RepID=A0A7Y9I4A3_9ACTN|nr:sulfatase-like hydrolase/transferase [Microlunatus parietis]NYE70001.1 arylsulfatase A-like enzyme [Microlunatus parietis]